MFKSEKFFMGFGIFVALFLIGGIYITSRKAANQDPIRIYKAAQTGKLTPVLKVSSTGTNPSDVLLEEFQIREPLPHEYIFDFSNESDESEPKVPIFNKIEASTVSGKSGEPDHNVSIDQDSYSFQQVHQQIERLALRIQTEYPELLELQYMTLEEMEDLSDRKKKIIFEQAQRFRYEYIEEIRKIFSKLPREHLEKVLSTFRQSLRQQWGEKITDRILAETRSHFE